MQCGGLAVSLTIVDYLLQAFLYSSYVFPGSRFYNSNSMPGKKHNRLIVPPVGCSADLSAGKQLFTQ